MVMDGSYVSRQVKRDPRTIDVGRRLGRMLVEKHLGAAKEPGAGARRTG